MPELKKRKMALWGKLAFSLVRLFGMVSVFVLAMLALAILQRFVFQSEIVSLEQIYGALPRALVLTLLIVFGFLALVFPGDWIDQYTEGFIGKPLRSLALSIIGSSAISIFFALVLADKISISPIYIFLICFAIVVAFPTLIYVLMRREENASDNL